MVFGFDSGVAVDVRDSGVASGLDAEVLGDAPGSPALDKLEPVFDDLASSGDKVAGLRAAEFDILVGINLLREGLDLPEVSLVCILDADKEGFLRSQTSLIQTAGVLRVRPPGTVKTTSSLLPRCSTCAVAPGCSRNETTVLSPAFCAFTSAKPRPRTVSARGTSLWGIFT